MECEPGQRRAIDRSIAAVATAGVGLVFYLLIALGVDRDGCGASPGGERAANRPAAEKVEAPAPAESVGTGPHEFRGTITDASGRPVDGVWVAAEPEPVASSSSRPASAPSSSSGDAVAVVSAPTDRGGGFVLRGLVAGRHRLRVDGRAILAAEVRFVDVPGGALQIVVSRRADVRGRVVAGGRPVAGAVVHLLVQGASTAATATTDQSGGFAFRDLAEGRFRLWAAAGDRASPAQSVDRVGPGPFSALELALAPAAVVGGRVVDSATGRGVSAHVTLIADDPDEPPRAAESSPGGDFRVEGVPPGRWTADAFAPGYVSADAVRFEAGRDYAPTIALRRGGSLAGRVRDATGAPIAGARVIARAEDGGADISAETVARRLGATGGAGGWDPALAVSSASLPGAGLVTATGLRFLPRGELGVLVGPLPFPSAAGAAAAVRIASPTGRAAEAGAPLPGGGAAPADPALEPRFTTDGEGRFRLTGLVPGRYRVLASHPGFADGASPMHEVSLDHARGDLDIVLYAGLILIGAITDENGAPVAGATVEARAGRGGPDPRYTTTGADGRYRLGSLTAEVFLEVSAAGHGGAGREIAAGRLGSSPVVRREDFQLARADAALDGRVLDASGFAVAGARVRPAGARGTRRGLTATTDAAGRFRLTGVVAGRQRLRVEHPDFPAAELEAATGSANELRLPFGGGAAIDVRDRSSGAPIAGAVLVARGPGDAERRATCDRSGRAELVSLAPGSWTVEASARGYAASAVSVEVPAGARPRQLTASPVRIELARGATLAGTVRDRDGERVSGATVTAGLARTTTDGDGRFRLTGVASGSVTLEADKGDAYGALALDLAPGEELVTIEIRLE